MIQTEKTAPFFIPDRVCRTVQTSAGPCSLPLRYFSACNVMMTFAVDPERARSLLPSEAFELQLNEQSKAQVLVGFWDYFDTSIGPYTESMIALMVICPGFEQPGCYVCSLPVSTELACRAGIEIFHYPKFVAENRIVIEGPQVALSVVLPDGKTVLSVTGSRSDSFYIPAMSIQSYAEYVDAPDIEPVVQTNGMVTVRSVSGRSLPVGVSHTIINCAPTVMYSVSSGNGLVLRAGDADHFMQHQIKTLGLDGISPVCIFVSNNFQSTLDVAYEGPVRTVR